MWGMEDCKKFFLDMKRFNDSEVEIFRKTFLEHGKIETFRDAHVKRPTRVNFSLISIVWACKDFYISRMVLNQSAFDSTGLEERVTNLQHIGSAHRNLLRLV